MAMCQTLSQAPKKGKGRQRETITCLWEQHIGPRELLVGSGCVKSHDMMLINMPRPCACL